MIPIGSNAFKWEHDAPRGENNFATMNFTRRIVPVGDSAGKKPNFFNISAGECLCKEEKWFDNDGDLLDGRSYSEV